MDTMCNRATSFSMAVVKIRCREVIFDGTFPTEEWNDNLKDRGKAGMRNPKVRILAEFFNGSVDQSWACLSQHSEIVLLFLVF